MELPNFFVILLICAFASFADAEQCRVSTSPKAIYSRTRLPYRHFGMSAIYNGDDSILIFEGETDNRQFHSFDLTTEQLTSLGRLPVKGTFSPLVRIQDGSFLYFGNDPVAQRVFRYDPSSNSSSIVAELAYNLEAIKSFFTSSDPTKVYLTSSVDRPPVINIFEFDTVSFCVERLEPLTGQATWVPTTTLGNFSYIFPSSGNRSVIQIGTDTRGITQLGESNVGLGIQFSTVTTVSSNKHLYVLGGYGRGSPFPTDGILQYNLEENQFKFIRIDEMPQKLEERFDDPPSMVFVEKLNRIYFFGGKTYSSGLGASYFDLIWSIDVSLME